MLESILPKILITLIVVLVLVILMCGYVKAAPDQAILISGLRKNARTLIGRAGIKIPFLERKDVLSLQLISIDVKTSSSVPTADYINIMVDATVNVKISGLRGECGKGSVRGKCPGNRGKNAPGGDGKRQAEVCKSGERKRRAGFGGNGS